MTPDSKLIAIIVEDEEKDRKVIEKILSDYYHHLVTVVAVCQEVDKAIEAISSYTPDLVFMDIVIQGNRFGAFEILEHVNLDFQVVFITGNSDSEYYSKAIKMHCLDFIIKPTSIDDFAGPLARAWEKKHESQQQIERTIYIKQLEQFIDAFKKRQTNPPIPIPVEYGHIIIKTDDIIKCVSEGNYTEFFLADHSKKIANGNLKHFELYLSEYNIIRIHRKCMINLLHISLYQKKEGGIITLSNGDIVYVGDVWRTSFEKAYNTFFHISDTSA